MNVFVGMLAASALTAEAAAATDSQDLTRSYKVSLGVADDTASGPFAELAVRTTAATASGSFVSETALPNWSALGRFLRVIEKGAAPITASDRDGTHTGFSVDALRDVLDADPAALITRAGILAGRSEASRTFGLVSTLDLSLASDTDLVPLPPPAALPLSGTQT